MRTDADIQVGPPARASRLRVHHRAPSWALKTAMAASGALWAAFVAIHLFGNLKVFQGAEAFNGYAAWLRAAFYPLLPKEFLLWALRIALLASLLVHIGCAGAVWWRGRRARGPHRARITGVRAWGSWLMPLTGIVILAFIAIHLFDLTLGLAPAATASFHHPAADGTAFAYENLVASLRRPIMAWFYVAVMVLLAAHIAKGATTMAVDLGVMGRRWRVAITLVGALLAIAILLGNAAIPLLIQFGAVS